MLYVYAYVNKVCDWPREARGIGMRSRTREAKQEAEINTLRVKLREKMYRERRD